MPTTTSGFCHPEVEGSWWGRLPIGMTSSPTRGSPPPLGLVTSDERRRSSLAIASESWGNDIRRWFSRPPRTLVHGQAGSGDETRKEFLLGGETSAPVNTDSLWLGLDCLTLGASPSPPPPPPRAIASWTVRANLWTWYHASLAPRPLSMRWPAVGRRVTPPYRAGGSWVQCCRWAPVSPSSVSQAEVVAHWIK